MIDDIKWSEVISLKDKAWLSVEEKPGVYCVQCTAHAIERANGIDNEGILHVGMSSNLQRRIREFYKAATINRNIPHSAGWEYFEYGFDKKFPTISLICRYLYKETRGTARELEKELQKQYRKKFLDHPPLDGQI